MSYYQKYRPEKIEELDLGLARESFLLMMKAGKVAHAYLLVGPRGSGKTSAARILARVVNCEKNKDVGELAEACGECEACLAIKSGSAVDVMEIDAASHRGIDDIRDLREKARLAPTSLYRKVYIIDEVHMLTNEAFNALLKILEEPPRHVMFVLCTTEAHKIPATIVSRCVRVNFSKAKTSELVASLMRAAVGEGLEIEEGALTILANGVDGSFREGHKVLEQLAVKSKKITKELVIKSLGMMTGESVEKILELVRGGKAAELVKMIREMEEGGVEVVTLVSNLLEQIRVDIEEAVIGGKSINKVDKKLTSKLVTISSKIKTSPVPILPLEMALLAVALKVGGNDNGGLKEESKKEVVIRESKNTKEIGAKLEAQTSEELTDKVMTKVELDQITSGWQELLSRLTPKNHSVAGLLRSAKPKEIHDKFLTIEVFYKFHKEQIEQEARRKVIEEEISKLWGPLGVRCVLGEKAQQALRENPEVENISGKVDDAEVLKAVEDIFGV